MPVSDGIARYAFAHAIGAVVPMVASLVSVTASGLSGANACPNRAQTTQNSKIPAPTRNS